MELFHILMVGAVTLENEYQDLKTTRWKEVILLYAILYVNKICNLDIKRNIF